MEELHYHTVANKGLLYCFGHGLSYTQFKYENLHIDSIHTHTGHVQVSCKITNTGRYEGDEVIQLYVNDVISSTTTYEKNLRGFERIHLKPGESRTVHFSLVPDDLILINANHERVVEPGEFKVMIGSSYEDIRLTGSFYYRSTQTNPTHRTNKKEKIMNDTEFVQ